MAASPAERALGERHLQRQQVIQRGLADALGLVLARLPLGAEAPDPVTSYGTAALPLVQGSQRQALALAAAYATSAARVRRIERGQAAGPVVTRSIDLAAALAPVLATASSASVRSPALRLLGKLAEDVPEAEARATAAGYADQLALGDLQTAQRAGLTAGAEASGARVVGWRKQPSADACPWCRERAGQQYAKADSVPFHSGDRCSVAPVYERGG
jgi:hypothetical protein